MNASTLIEILKIAGPILGAFLGVGGIGAYYAYRTARPKTDAEAQKIKADVVVTFADGWQKYAQKLEERMDALEKSMDEKEKEHAKIVLAKDQRIDELEQRVSDLETELENYRGQTGRAETAKNDLHQAVEDTMDSVIRPEGK